MTKTVTVVAVKATMANPTGDPTDSGEAAEGINEFTFDGSDDGYCYIKCLASLSPDTEATTAWAEQNISWAISPGISGSTMAWGNFLGGVFTAADNKGKEVWIQFKGLPSSNSEFGDKNITMTVIPPDYKESNPIQIFFTKTATNHPGGEASSPNWYHYWKEEYGGSMINTVYEAACHGLAEVKGMTHWAYNAVPDKTTRFIHDGSAEIIVWDDPEFGPWTGIDCFYNIYLHESYHTIQISDVDAVVGTAAGTCWQYGWSWNQVNDNHWAVGNDGQPGIMGTDDDGDGGTDNQITTGPGEMGFGDDKQLDTYFNHWPDAWGVPPAAPWAQDHPIEHICWREMIFGEHQFAYRDWGNPGKQHRINLVHNN